jgi:hypothetical protein
MKIYSSKNEMIQIVEYLTAYMKIPYFQDDNIPGKVMEKILSLVRGGDQLATYDYVDVCVENSVGWQVKSTKSDTPLTWKRAKIANSEQLIAKSEENDEGLVILGNAIIDLCNNHAAESIEKYKLEEIGYSRLIIFPDNTAIYFERLICTKDSPEIFDKSSYTWKWSPRKSTKKKEQLSALHGLDKSNKKVFSWHGRGENQLHFSGESDWWPRINRPIQLGEINFSCENHAVAFKLPVEADKVSWDNLTRFLNDSN